MVSGELKMFGVFSVMKTVHCFDSIYQAFLCHVPLRRLHHAKSSTRTNYQHLTDVLINEMSLALLLLLDVKASQVDQHVTLEGCSGVTYSFDIHPRVVL